MKKATGASFLMCALTISILTGCGKSDQELVLEYLTEKYDEAFVVLDSTSSEDGRTPFSYSFTAYCAPADHPEYMFRTVVNGLGSNEQNTFRDFYGTGILNVRIAGLLKEKLDPFFGNTFITAELNRTGSQILPDMEEIDYFTFLGINSEQAPDRKTNIDFQVAVSNAAYQAESYTDEYDTLVKTASEISEELHAGCNITILFMEEDAYQTYTAWSRRTLYPFPYQDYVSEYKSIRIAYDPVEGKVVPGMNQQEPMTSEMYAEKRKEN